MFSPQRKFKREKLSSNAILSDHFTIFICCICWTKKLFFYILCLFSAASVNYPELSAYVSAEMKSLTEEIASLEKVTVKLESEMRQAMEIKGQFKL